MNLSLVDFTCVVFWQVLIDQLHKCTPKKFVHLINIRRRAGQPNYQPEVPNFREGDLRGTNPTVTDDDSALTFGVDGWASIIL